MFDVEENAQKRGVAAGSRVVAGSADFDPHGPGKGIKSRSSRLHISDGQLRETTF